MPRTLMPRATVEGLAVAQRRDAVFLPALAPFAAKDWPLVAVLPVLDINGTLASSLAARRAFGGSAPVAGIFASDPFLRVADLAVTLRAGGITEVVNYPTIQLFDGETAAALGSVGYRAESEFRLLLRLAEQGLSPIACAMSQDAAEQALRLGLRRVLLHQGLVAARRREWWAECAGHVAIEGGEALAWRAPSPAQSSRPSRRIRL